MKPFKVFVVVSGSLGVIAVAGFVAAERLGAFDTWSGWQSWLLWMAVGALIGEVGYHFEERAKEKSEKAP